MSRDALVELKGLRADVIVLITVNSEGGDRLPANVIISSVGCDTKDVPGREVLEAGRGLSFETESLPYSLADFRRLKSVADIEKGLAVVEGKPHHGLSGI